MPIVEHPVAWRAVCDSCGDEYGVEEYGGYVLFESAEQARADLDDNGWRTDGCVICPVCLEDEAVS